MKFYLSSYGVGKESEKIKKLMLPGKKLGLIPNALDHAKNSIKTEICSKALNEILELGLNVELLDLQDYFSSKGELKRKIGELGGIWVIGGNTFVLRKAMNLSGLDIILKKMKRKTFLYGGYSAGGCVLSPKLDYLQIVDNPTITPYKDKTVIWDGLDLIKYAFLPHYKSDHPESADIDKEVHYCEIHKIPYKTLKDGEVIIIE